VKVGETKQVKLEQYSASKDIKGDWKETITNSVLTFAGVTSRSGVRQFFDGQIALVNTLTFRVRWNPSVYPTGNWRVIYMGRKHVITSIERVNEKRFYLDFIAVSQGKR
jgi:head-tail adaptor